MAAARTFRMEGMDRAPLERLDRILDEPRLVQRVGMNRDLHVVPFGDIQACGDRRRRRPPVFMQLQSDGARLDLLRQSLRQRRIALSEKAKVDGKAIGRFEHTVNVPWT